MGFDIDGFAIGMISFDKTKAYAELLPESYVGYEESTILIGAAAEGCAAGVLWAQITDSGCEIMHLAVHPAFRRRGIAKKMLERFLSVICRMENPMPVYLCFTDDEINKTFKAFLDAAGCFVFFEKGFMVRISGKELKNADGYKKLKAYKESDNNTVSFFSLSGKDAKRIVGEMSEKDILFPQDILKQQKMYEDPLCLCVMENNNPASIIFIRKTDDTLQIRYMYGNDNLGGIRKLLGAVVKEIEKKYPEYNIEAETDRPSVRRILNYISDGAAREYPVLIAMWDMLKID